MLATATLLVGCKGLLGIEEGVVATSDAAVADAVDDAPVDMAPDAPPGTWWNPLYLHRRPVTFTTTGLALPISNLPVLIRIPGAVAQGLDPTAMRVIADDHATSLPFEIEQDTNGTSVVWVKMTLAQGSRVWLYYSVGVEPSLSSGAAVFGADYESVHHFATGLDSTGNGHDLSGTASLATAPSRVISAAQFNGINDYYALANSDAPFDFGGEMSVSLWMYAPAFAVANAALVAKGDTAWRVQRDASTRHVAFVTGTGSQGTTASSTSVTDDLTWHHVLVTFGSLGIKTIYVDGVEEDMAFGTNIGTNAIGVRIGAIENVAGRFFQGAIDELRISAKARSAAWAKAEFAMTDPSFSTIGAEEQAP